MTEMCKTGININSAKRHSSIFSFHLSSLNRFIIVVNLVLVFYPNFLSEYYSIFGVYKFFDKSFAQNCLLSVTFNLR